VTATVVGPEDPSNASQVTIVAPLPMPVTVTNTLAFAWGQGQAEPVWEFDHPLPYNPNITVEDSNGNIVEPDIIYSPGHVLLDFGGVSMSGRANLS
jgi:hypothetical protein